jgi:hypothetical protein
MRNGIDVQSIALVLSLIDLGFPSALVGAVEDHRTAPTFACSVGLSEDKVVIALLDIVVRYWRCMTCPYLYFALDLFSRVGPDIAMHVGNARATGTLRTDTRLEYHVITHLRCS